MDFLRRVFGLKSHRSNQNTIPEKDGQNQDNGYAPFTPFSFFNQPNSDDGQSSSHYSDGKEHYGLMDSFQQIQQMMDMMDKAMSDFSFLEPGVYPQVILPPPDSPDTSHNFNPRDQYLKKPDSQLPSPPLPGGDSCYEDHDESCALHQRHSDAPYHNRNWNPGFGFGNLFRMLDELMTPFGNDDFLRPNDNLPIGDGSQPEAPREAFLKQDQDLDKRPACDLSELLEEGPGYSAASTEGFPPPGYHQPAVQSNFTSTSISRTLRSDGMIEERRTYRDSSGREEVTVTEIDPATTQSLVPNPFNGGGGFFSIFGKFF